MDKINCSGGLARSIILAPVIAIMAASGPNSHAQTSTVAYPSTFKVAYFNIQSGHGEQPLPGQVCSFTENTNCADPTQPLNAWGTGIVQAELTREVASDASVVALGLSEAWGCATPAAVLRVLGWAAASTEHNGIAVLARYGFGGPEEWTQLDTSANLNPVDTMWLVRVPVCLDARCSASIPVYSAHWLANTTLDANVYPIYERQAQQTIDALSRAPAGQPHLLVGDLNVFEGHEVVCSKPPINQPPQMLRSAGYLDGWTAVHATAEGNTGMWNRVGCGSPEGALWKRIDYSWSKNLNVLSMRRFGMVQPGMCAPSDHAGIIVEYQHPGGIAGNVPPAIAIRTPGAGQTVERTTTVTVDASDDDRVTRVELLIDGAVKAVTGTSPFSFDWDTRQLANGPHVLEAAATDSSGNRTVSSQDPVTVNNPSASGDEVVLYGKDATSILGNWQLVADSTAAGGMKLRNPDAGAATLVTALPSPTSYVEFTFTATAGQPYRLWVRGSADADSPDNDSIHAQFSGSVDASGASIYRIGSQASTKITLEDCDGCGVQGWGWQDNGFGRDVMGPVVYFAVSGTQRLRIQGREDGMSIDQIVLSAVKYLHSAPGAAKLDTTIVPPVGTGTPPPPPPPSPSPYDEAIVYATTAAITGTGWAVVTDATAAGGARIQNPDAATPKLTAPFAAPASYFEVTFNAAAGRPYRFWMRGKAAGNSYLNDSAFVQFDGSVNAAGAPQWRIGTSSAATYVLEDCSGCALDGWGWQDDGYGAGVLGPVVYFATTGAQRMRVQAREDGLGIDQIVVSAVKYLTVPPGLVRADGTILGGSTPPPIVQHDEVVLYVSNAALTGGGWNLVPDTTAAGGLRLQNPDAGVAKLTVPQPAPASYVELTFNATAGKPYRLWLRGKAEGNSYLNDSAYIQFDGSVTATGVPQWRIGSNTAATYVLEECSGCALGGWGWQDNGYGAGVLGPVLYFAASGMQRLRIQSREDGLGIDQIVLSAGTYLNAAPGAPRADFTILPPR